MGAIPIPDSRAKSPMEMQVGAPDLHGSYSTSILLNIALTIHSINIRSTPSMVQVVLEK